MKAPHIIIIITTVSLLYNCTISEMDDLDSEEKESCDFGICEAGRNAIDTLIDVHGVLRKKDDLYYIEVTGNAPTPDTLFISCVSEVIDFPEEDNYVICSGTVKEPCSDEISISKDSIFLQKLEVIIPVIQDNCETQISSEDYNINKIDDRVNIHHLAREGDCLNILISYEGNCNQLPNLTLHNSNDILFGEEITINVNLQGDINDNCNSINYAVLRFDISPIWVNLNLSSTSQITLYFQSQGYLRIQ